ncbi:glycosyltransferase [Afifella sp. IM 167]|nr:glycosyltransferase [Afifella sp. IM 167]
MLSVVVPCYNEQEVLPLTHARLLEAFGAAPFRFQIVYVNDGSRDATGAMLEEYAAADTRVKAVILSRNFGHQAAVSAGLAHADGDAIGIIDADLQDPPEVILAMLDKWRAGYDVIYGVRRKRKESLFKRTAYTLFYRIFRSVAEVDMPLDAGDFCLMDRHVLDVLNDLPESERYLRGLRAWVGFSQTALEYERAVRAAGVTKYPFRKLVKLAADGIFSFSTAPLTLVFYAGLITAAIAVAGLIFTFVQRVFDITVFGVAPTDIPGFTALALMILFLGAVQMLSVGILGEYIGRIFVEVKRRPTYIVRTIERTAEGGTAGPKVVEAGREPQAESRK